MVRSFAVGALLVAAALTASMVGMHLEHIAQHRHVDLKSLVPDRVDSWQRIPPPGVGRGGQGGQPAGPYEAVIESHYLLPGAGSIMLSIAYGANQLNDKFQAHRPEFCFKAQGFDVLDVQNDRLQASADSIPVRRMLAVRKERVEHVTYWMTISGRAVLPGMQRKLLQLRSGFRGEVPDGFLIRVSSIGGDPRSSMALQDRFVNAWLKSLPASARPYILGRTG